MLSFAWGTDLLLAASLDVAWPLCCRCVCVEMCVCVGMCVCACVCVRACV